MLSEEDGHQRPETVWPHFLKCSAPADPETGGGSGLLRSRTVNAGDWHVDTGFPLGTDAPN